MKLTVRRESGGVLARPLSSGAPFRGDRRGRDGRSRWCRRAARPDDHSGPYHNGQRDQSVGRARTSTSLPIRGSTSSSARTLVERRRTLPISVNTCDGNTIQGVTILVQPNGSLFEHGYQLYALPNASQLGESSDTQPVCNQKKSCVLYIGQNQEKFTAPKMFSPRSRS